MHSLDYSHPTYLHYTDGGNALLMPENGENCLRIAAVKSGTLDDVQLSNEIAFLSSDDGEVRAGLGLDFFIKTKISGVPAWVFDNHNHALYFWYEARKKGYIQNGATLVHIDMHSDLWKNEFTLSPQTSENLEEVWKFTNFFCNVGNYIKPAMQEGIVGEMIRIEGEQDLMREANRVLPKNVILNLDLDFFAEELDDIAFEFKKRVILHFAKQAQVITISTSPFFIPGDRAISMLHKVFANSSP